MSKTANTYSYPVSQKLVSNIVEETTSQSHDGAYKGSVDFAVPVGTDVLAAADGVVTRVRDDSSAYGDQRKFGYEVNYITIEHPNAELSEYLHLAKDSALIGVGDKVKAGQKIAQTGLSGWLYAPHLHFMVYKKDTAFQCLEIVFKD